METVLTTANVIYGSQTAVTVNGVRTVVPNPYNDGGCYGKQRCKGYYIGVPCLADIYQGVTACQELYLMDGSGNPVDLSRLDYIAMNIFNEYECKILTFSSLGDVQSDGRILFMQGEGERELFRLTPSNFNDREDLYFVLNNVSVLDSGSDSICPSDTSAIVVGNYGEDCGSELTYEAGFVLFNPIDFDGNAYIKVMAEEYNEGECIVRFNGMPHPIAFGEKVSLFNFTESNVGVLELASYDINGNPSMVRLSEIVFGDDSDKTDIGKFKICYDGNLTSDMIPSFLTATVDLKFKDTDPIEHGAAHVITCVGLGTLRKHYVDTTPLPNEV